MDGRCVFRDINELDAFMFNENPFSGACVASTFEVLVMLAGTFALGVLLGYLIWGWLRREIVRLRESVAHAESISTARESRITSMVSLTTTLKDEVERLETKVSLAEYRLRRAQEESFALQEALSGQQSAEGATLSEVPQREDGPTLADITHAMDGSQEGQDSTAGTERDRRPQQALRRGESPESIEMARQVLQREVHANDLKLIRGIGPRVEEVLHRAGIRTWADLAQSALPQLREILSDAGPRYRMFDPKTWSVQARMAAKGEWRKLKAYQETLADEGEEV